MTQNKLDRSLGFLDATLIVAGSMIGSGIFIVTSQMARDIGSSGWILVVWALTGFITVLAALSYGELAGMMPNAGGQFVYIQRAFGKRISFLYGWTVFTVIQTGVIAAVAVAFAKYTAVFYPSLSKIAFAINGYINVSYAQILAILSIVILTFVNAHGVRNGKVIQVVFTSAKIIALFALIGIGCYIGFNSESFQMNFSDMWNAGKTSVSDSGQVNFSPLSNGALVGALGATIIYSLFSSDAWNNVTFIAGEIKDPQRNIPRSLFFGTLIVTIIYILANVSYLMLLPIHGDPTSVDALGRGIMFANDDRVGEGAAIVLFGSFGGLLMAALIMVSTFGCNNGLILAGSRLYYAMSKDGLFFKSASKLNSKHVPARALWIQCVWASVLCLSGKYGDLLEYSTFASLLFYILTIAGIFVLRRKEPNTHRPYRAIGYPVLPIIYIVLTGAICIDLLIYKPYTAGLGLFIVCLGIPVYYFLEKKNN
jgi:APA family basic amino acid/polyamine antiporter